MKELERILTRALTDANFLKNLKSGDVNLKENFSLTQGEEQLLNSLLGKEGENALDSIVNASSEAMLQLLPSLQGMGANKFTGMERVAPKLERVAPKLERVAPKLERVSPKLERVAPKLERVAPKLERVAPKVERVSPKLERVAPKLERVAPKLERVAPKLERIESKLAGIENKSGKTTSD